ncbi:MAG TPA: hypothetical protein DCM28_15790 [Phycisphaerales bacterium]|nr:hypothetical protein [Phycisphaerales bacterium]|tara:strand:+ start:864 stop:1061 length:198 start_codon:yes stop_codon:yes gene_type:complete
MGVQDLNTSDKTREKLQTHNTGAAKSAADSNQSSLADAIRAIMSLPLTDNEKADAVRRLLQAGQG